MVHKAKKKSLGYFDIMFLGVPRSSNPDAYARFFYFAQEEGYTPEELNAYLKLKK